MLLYFIYIITIWVLISFVYIKLRYRFWSSQPVFHTYNLHYWFFPPGILQHTIPEITKFFDYAITYKKLNSLDAKERNLVLSFIKMNYHYDKKFKYDLKKSDIIDIFPGDSNITLHYNLIPKRLISCLTSRTLECSTELAKFNVLYFDLLCVHRNYRGRGFGAKQIYTHYLKSRKATDTAVFLYKSFGPCNIRVPITIFNTYTVLASSWNKPNLNLPRNISTHLIHSMNCELLIHFTKEIAEQFDCKIIPKTFTLTRLIKQGYLVPTVILDNQTVVAATFFRRPMIKIDNKYIIECIGSCCRVGYENYFKESFQNSIVLLQKYHKFSMITIENISHNYMLVQRVLERSIPKRVDTAGYYFYNCAISPYFSPDVFIIN